MKPPFTNSLIRIYQEEPENCLKKIGPRVAGVSGAIATLVFTAIFWALFSTDKSSGAEYLLLLGLGGHRAF